MASQREEGGGGGGHFPQHGAELEGRGTETWEMHAETEEEEEKRRDPASLITILCIQDKRNGRSFTRRKEETQILCRQLGVFRHGHLFLFRRSVGIFSDLFGKMHDVRNSRFSSPILGRWSYIHSVSPANGGGKKIRFEMGKPSTTPPPPPPPPAPPRFYMPRAAATAQVFLNALHSSSSLPRGFDFSTFISSPAAAATREIREGREKHVRTGSCVRGIEHRLGDVRRALTRIIPLFS